MKRIILRERLISLIWKFHYDRNPSLYSAKEFSIKWTVCFLVRYSKLLFGNDVYRRHRCVRWLSHRYCRRRPDDSSSLSSWWRCVRPLTQSDHVANRHCPLNFSSSSYFPSIALIHPCNPLNTTSRCLLLFFQFWKFFLPANIVTIDKFSNKNSHDGSLLFVNSLSLWIVFCWTFCKDWREE